MSHSSSPRWGIIGCGRISWDFVSSIKSLNNVVVQACAARSLADAHTFANNFGITQAYDSYEALVSDANVDVVYIGTLHPWHYEHTVLALNHGKHVLVEKPMAMNAIQASAAIALAREKKLFLLEGMWTRFFPAIRYVRQLLNNKEIGDVHHVHAAFGVPFGKDNARIWHNELGGGGLLDIGIYPLAFATMVFGTKPEKITSAGKRNDGGVDIYSTVTLEYSDSRFATIEYTMLAKLDESVTITGSKGRICLPAAAHTATEVQMIKYFEDGTQKETKSLFPWPMPAAGVTFIHLGSEGLRYEAEAVIHAIQKKELESNEYSLDESLGIMTIMDKIRKDLGVVYPADTQGIFKCNYCWLVSNTRIYNLSMTDTGVKIDASTIADPFSLAVRQYIDHEMNGVGPKLVGLLAHGDPAAKKYAEWTGKACARDGIRYELREVPKDELLEALDQANHDPDVHGILVYYPCFGTFPSFFGGTMDDFLRDSISIKKDVEGLCQYYRGNLYRNIRFIDDEKTQKCVLPCTPLAIVKILEHLGIYDKSKPDGNHLADIKITIINRSDIVGRPLAAMLANDGADVYSADIDSLYLFRRGKLIPSDETQETACKKSRVIITGVPVKSYKLPLNWVSENTVIINVASFKNVDEAELLKIKGVQYVPLVGKVTVAMLERNLLRLYENFHWKPKKVWQ
ncbi:putative tetrahydrofolate dehydrogenase/cyclohydrolase, oxidoreductase [Plasmopara halstedii]